MSKFLDELQDLADAGFHEDIIEQINSLGENARRMLEIGIVQDELVKLGFEHFLPYISCLMGVGIMIDFDCDKVRLLRHDIDFNYTSPTWQEDLLTYVKELIK